jgi:hypothetical protein
LSGALLGLPLLLALPTVTLSTTLKLLQITNENILKNPK